MKEVKLKEIAYIRASEKGDTWNLPLIPYRATDVDLLREQVTVEFVESVFPELTNDARAIELYEYHGLNTINLVMSGVLEGGVSRTINMNEHARSREEPLLEATIEVPEEYNSPDVVDGSKVWNHDS